MQPRRTRTKKTISALHCTRRWRSEGSRSGWSGVQPAASTGRHAAPTVLSVTTVLRCVWLFTFTHLFFIWTVWVSWVSLHYKQPSLIWNSLNHCMRLWLVSRVHNTRALWFSHFQTLARLVLACGYHHCYKSLDVFRRCNSRTCLCSAAVLLVYDGRRSVSVDGCKRVGQPVVVLWITRYSSSSTTCNRSLLQFWTWKCFSIYSLLTLLPLGTCVAKL